MRSANVELPVMGLLDNYDGVNWRIKEMAAMLGSKTARHNLVRDVVDFAVGAHEAGIVVDFEEVPDATQPYFRQFAAELGPALHSVGLKLMMALPARDDAYDYKFFGRECDAIVRSLRRTGLSKISARFWTMYRHRSSSWVSPITRMTGRRRPRKPKRSQEK
jgi:hypothetical protein